MKSLWSEGKNSDVSPKKCPGLDACNLDLECKIENINEQQG